MAAIALLTPTRPGFHHAPTEAESTAWGAHFAYLESLIASGDVVVAGPTEDGSLGLVVFARADAAAAQAMIDADPAIACGVMTAEVKPWRMSLFGTGTKRDWLGFTQAIQVDAATERVFELIATCAGLERWFIRRATASCDRAQFLPVGDRLSLTWRGMNDADMTEVDGVLACEPMRRMRIGWYEDKGWVEFRVTARASGGSTVELEQRMHPSADRALIEQAYIGCREGWAFYLANLKSVAEGGRDLRDPRPDRPGLVNV